MRRRFLLGLVSIVLAGGALHCHETTPGVTAQAPNATTTDAGTRAVPSSSAARAELPSHDAICAMTTTVTEPNRGAKPFERPDGLCKGYQSNTPEPCGMADRYDFPPTKGDTCFLAQSNIDDAARKTVQGTRAIAAPRLDPTSSMTSMPPPAPTPVATAWDKNRPPKYAAKVDAHLHFTEAERALLAKNGFVVLERRPVHSYVAAYHDVFQEQLPLYVTADSILHAVFRSEDALLEGIERTDLKKRAVDLVNGLRAALRSVPASEAAEDVDLYLTVAERLMERPSPTSRFPKNDALADDLAHKMDKYGESAGIATVEIYGRKRDIDFSKFAPAGHYAGYRPDDSPGGKQPALSFGSYFQVLTWLSRHEWNLVTRGCQSSTPVEGGCSPAETPREARAAMLVAELVDRANARPHLDRFEQVYSTFGGVRDDVPIASFKKLALPASQAPNAPDALKTAIGAKYVRYAVTHPMPVFPGDHEGKLPAIATLIGARVAPDLDPVGSVMRAVYPANLDADVFGALLGHDAAARGAARKQGHDVALGLAPKLRADSAAGSSLYDAWMTAVLALSTPAEGTLPSFWKTQAHAALRLDSALVGYGQIRHNFVLMSGSAYDSYGCDIPDAYVEPHLPVYEALLKYSERGRAMSGRDEASRDYFTKTSAVLRALITIVKHELEGRALTSDEARYLGMVTEYTPDGGYGGDSHGPPKRMGWYYDLFTDRTNLAEKGSDFIGEVATNAHTHYAFMLGAEAARLGVFVVDAGGEPRMMVGPVATGYEARDGLTNPRWTDGDAWKKPHLADWAKSYTAPAPPEPTVEGKVEHCDDGSLRLFVRASAATEAEITLTDHHGDAASPKTKLAIGPEGAVFAVREGKPKVKPDAGAPRDPMVVALGFGLGESREPSPFAGLHVRVAPHREGTREIPAYDLVLGPSVYHSGTGEDRDAQGEDREPHLAPRRRYRNLGDFALGAFDVPKPKENARREPPEPR